MSSKRKRKIQISYKSQLFSINDTPDWIWRVSRRDHYKSPSKSVSSTRCRLSLARVFPRPARFQHRLLRAWLKGYSSVSPFEHRKCSSLITKCNTVVASSDAKKKGGREEGKETPVEPLEMSGPEMPAPGWLISRQQSSYSWSCYMWINFN